MNNNFFHVDYDFEALNKDLLNNNIKFFQISNLEDITFEKLGKVLFLNEYCSDYEVHAGRFLVCYFKNSDLCREYINENLKEVTYKQYLELVPSQYFICGKPHMMGERLYELIVHKHIKLGGMDNE